MHQIGFGAIHRLTVVSNELNAVKSPVGQSVEESSWLHHATDGTQLPSCFFLDDARDIFQLRDDVARESKLLKGGIEFTAGVEWIEILQILKCCAPCVFLLLCVLDSRNRLSSTKTGNLSFNARPREGLHDVCLGDLGDTSAALFVSCVVEARVVLSQIESVSDGGSVIDVVDASRSWWTVLTGWCQRCVGYREAPPILARYAHTPSTLRPSRRVVDAPRKSTALSRPRETHTAHGTPRLINKSRIHDFAHVATAGTKPYNEPFFREQVDSHSFQKHSSVRDQVAKISYRPSSDGSSSPSFHVSEFRFGSRLGTRSSLEFLNDAFPELLSSLYVHFAILQRLSAVDAVIARLRDAPVATIRAATTNTELPQDAVVDANQWVVFAEVYIQLAILETPRAVAFRLFPGVFPFSLLFASLLRFGATTDGGREQQQENRDEDWMSHFAMWRCCRLRQAVQRWGSHGTAFRALFATEPTSPTFYDSTIEKYAKEPLQKLSLAEMLRIGQAALRDDSYCLHHARFVQRELPKRLARRLLDLRFLPHIVVTNPHIKRVYDAYYKALGVLLPLEEIRTNEQNAEFTEILKQLLDEQTQLLDELAAGLRECLIKKSITERINLQPFVEGILRSRIGRRVLAQHHIGLQERQEGFIGCICTELDVHQAIQASAAQAQAVCRQIYGTGPDVSIDVDGVVSMPYIPAHLDYMLFELFKNCMKALMGRGMGTVPSIRTRICESPSTVTIRISDEGGGIAPEHLEQVWEYGYSTTQTTVPYVNAAPFSSFWLDGQQSTRSDLSGYGFGLPFARLHARYFGGDLQLVSIPGFGVDVFLTTKKLDRAVWSEVPEHEDLERLEYTSAAEIQRSLV